MDKEQVVRQQDEEDRKDVDHPDARLDEEHPVEAGERRSRDRKQPIRPQASREEVHHRDAQRSEKGRRDAPTEGVEAKVDVVATRALEMGSPPTVSPLPRRDELFGERRLRVEVVEAAGAHLTVERHARPA